MRLTFMAWFLHSRNPSIVFHRFTPVACFPALGKRCLFSPRLAIVACFPAFSNRCLFSRAWQSLLFFPRLLIAACFPALGNRCCFPTPGTNYIFSAYELEFFVHFPCLASLACFPAPSTLWRCLLAICYIYIRSKDQLQSACHSIYSITRYISTVIVAYVLRLKSQISTALSFTHANRVADEGDQQMSFTDFWKETKNIL